MQWLFVDSVAYQQQGLWLPSLAHLQWYDLLRLELTLQTELVFVVRQRRR